jgi:hypothetical protein
VARIKQARLVASEDGPTYAKTVARYDDLDTRLVEIDQALALLQADFVIRAKDFSIPLTDMRSANDARMQTVGQMDGLGIGFSDFEEEIVERLVCAIRLLHVPKVAARINHARPWQEEFSRLLTALKHLNTQHKPLLELRNAHAALAVLAGNIEGNEENPALGDAIRSHRKEVLGRVLRIRHALSAATYPFDHAKGRISIGEYALPEGVEDDNLGAIYEAGAGLLENLSGLLVRIASRMAAMGERVELVLGLEPLPEPPESEQKPDDGE